MLVIAIYEEGARFVVHEVLADKSTIDVTADYEIRAMTCADEAGAIRGWHIGVRS